MNAKQRGEHRDSLNCSQAVQEIFVLTKDVDTVENHRRAAARSGIDGLVEAVDLLFVTTDAVYLVIWIMTKGFEIIIVPAMSTDGLLDSEELLELDLRTIVTRMHKDRRKSEGVDFRVKIFGPEHLTRPAEAVARKLKLRGPLRTNAGALR